MSLNRKLPARVRFADIITHAARIWNLPERTITGLSRLRENVHCRAAIVFVARSMPNPPSYPVIGRNLKRDHSTIMHLAERIEVYFDYEPDFGDKLTALFDACETGGAFVQERKDIETVIIPVRKKARNHFVTNEPEFVNANVDVRSGTRMLADAIKLTRAA